MARELEWITRSPPAIAGAGPGARRRTAVTTALSLVAGALIGVLGGYGVMRMMSSSPPAANTSRALIDVSPADQLRAAQGDQSRSAGHLSGAAIALSPDGQTLVFSAVKGNRQQLYARPLTQLEATPLSGTEGGASPFFSPDGKWVGFWASGVLKKLAFTSGSVTTLSETPAIFGASWGDNDVIVFANETGGLVQVPATGGAITPLTSMDASASEVSHRLPHVLPGSDTVLFTVTRMLLPTWDDDTQIVAYSITGKSRTVLLSGAADARYVPTGHLVYVRRGTLNAAPFSLGERRVTGGGVTLVNDLMQSANMETTGLDSGAGQFSVSLSGSLTYVRGGLYTFPERQMVWVDRTGRVEPLAAPPRAYLYPRLSPDASKVLVSTQGDRNVWVYDIARGATARIAVEGRNSAPTWTRDGQRVIFGSSTGGQENLFWSPADGSGTPERLTTSARTHRAGSWSPDGRVLAFVEGDAISENGRDILVLDAGKVRPFANSRYDELYPEFSPDGRWLAYTSTESGRSEVYVTPYPGPGPRMLVSTSGGHSSSWTKSGRELIYLAPLGTDGSGPYAVIAVDFEPRPTPTTGAPRKLFETPLGLSASVRGYDVVPDGSRLLMVQPQPRDPIRPSEIVLVQNWFDELVRRVPRN